MVRSLNLKAGDKIVAELIDDHIVLLPQPESWVDYFMGSMKGVYGSTKKEIDRYIAEVRYGWEIDALKNALAVDEELRAVYEAIPPSSEQGATLNEIVAHSHVDKGYIDQKLRRLIDLDAIKYLPNPGLSANPYYRRIP
jgi:hypothetical protein